MIINIISGTNRPGSKTKLIAAQIQKSYQTLTIPHRILDLADLPPEIFQPTAYQQKPETFTRFSQAILQSDGLTIITPEYNGSCPGILKYFIDMLKFPESFEQKPVCFIGLAAGNWGALRAVEHLQQIFGYRNAHIFPTRVFIPNIMNTFDNNNNLTDPDIKTRLHNQAENFAKFVKRLKQ